MATAHFSNSEWRCRCGCGGMPPQWFQDKIEELRVAFDAPLRINSGYRCPAHNAIKSKTGPRGPHTLAAVDLAVFGKEGYELLQLSFELGFTGIGISQAGPRGDRFIHLDVLEDTEHPRPWIWSY